MKTIRSARKPMPMIPVAAITTFLPMVERQNRRSRSMGCQSRMRQRIFAGPVHKSASAIRPSVGSASITTRPPIALRAPWHRCSRGSIAVRPTMP